MSSTGIYDEPYFNLFGEPPTLHIQNVQIEDAGSYVCRVDFAKSRTQYTKVNLTVIGREYSRGS